ITNVAESLSGPMILIGMLVQYLSVTCQCLLLEPKLLGAFGFGRRDMELFAGAFEERFGGIVFFSRGLLLASAACENQRDSERQNEPFVSNQSAVFQSVLHGLLDGDWLGTAPGYMPQRAPNDGRLL